MNDISLSRPRDEPTSVVLLGKGELAIRAALMFRDDSRYELRAVVPVIPEPAWTDSLLEEAGGLKEFSFKDGRWAARPIEIIDSGDYRNAPPADLALSIFYDRILPADWIARYGRVLNLHNAPLPAYRGVNPINWALKNGETSHGVTLHEVTPGVDDGPIVAQVTFPVWPATDEVADVYARCLAYGWTMLEQTLPILDRIRAMPQQGEPLIYYKTDAMLLGDRAGWRRP